jgi:hypothetical protein
MIHYNAAMTACAHGAFEQPPAAQQALALLKELQSEDMQRQGVQPDAYSYQIAVVACNRAKLWDDVLGVFAQMERMERMEEAAATREAPLDSSGGNNGNNGWTPSRLSCCAAVRAAQHRHDPARAHAIYAKMLGKPLAPPDCPAGRLFDPDAWHGTIRAALLVGHVAHASELLSVLEDSGNAPPVSVYNMLVHSCGFAALWPGAGEGGHGAALPYSYVDEYGVAPAGGEGAVLAAAAAATAEAGWAATAEGKEARRQRRRQRRRAKAAVAQPFGWQVSCKSARAAHAHTLPHTEIERCAPHRTNAPLANGRRETASASASCPSAVWQVAVDLLQRMRFSADRQPDIITYNSVIKVRR